MREVGFTVRRLMITVAGVAVLLAVGLEAARLARISAARRRYATSCAASESLSRKRALQFSQQARAVRDELDSIRSRHVMTRNEGGLPGAAREAVNRSFDQLWVALELKYRDTAARYVRNADYSATIRRKYTRAARSPWLSLEPDPPPAL
jgi:hypothetical protein